MAFAYFESTIIEFYSRDLAMDMSSKVNNYNKGNITMEKYKLFTHERGFKDVFDNKALKYALINNDIIFYSIGPDRIDNKASIIYDITNGIISIGDIVPQKYVEQILEYSSSYQSQ